MSSRGRSSYVFIGIETTVYTVTKDKIKHHSALWLVSESFGDMGSLSSRSSSTYVRSRVDLLQTIHNRSSVSPPHIQVATKHIDPDSVLQSSLTEYGKPDWDIKDRLQVEQGAGVYSHRLLDITSYPYMSVHLELIPPWGNDRSVDDWA